MRKILVMAPGDERTVQVKASLGAKLLIYDKVPRKQLFWNRNHFVHNHLVPWFQSESSFHLWQKSFVTDIFACSISICQWIIQLMNDKFCIWMRISLMVVPQGPIDNKWALVCIGLAANRWEAIIWANPGGRFKNAYELLNLRALKISMLYKNHIFQCMG